MAHRSSLGDDGAQWGEEGVGGEETGGGRGEDGKGEGEAEERDASRGRMTKLRGVQESRVKEGTVPSLWHQRSTSVSSDDDRTHGADKSERGRCDSCACGTRARRLRTY